MIVLKGGATRGETICLGWGRTFKSAHRIGSFTGRRAYRGAYLRKHAGWSEYMIGALIGWGVGGVSPAALDSSNTTDQLSRHLQGGGV